MTTTDHRNAAHVALRLAPWLVSLVTTVVGLSLLLNRTVSLDYEMGPNEWASEVLDVTGIGLALLCIGILSLMATLLSEAHLRARTPAPAPAPAAPGSDD